MSVSLTWSFSRTAVERPWGVELSAASVDVAVTGEMDVYTKEQVKSEIEALLGGHIRVITFDLTDVSTMDSAGLETLMFAVKRLREQGGRLRVKPGKWKRLFTLTRLDRMMDLI